MRQAGKFPGADFRRQLCISLRQRRRQDASRQDELVVPEPMQSER